ncbi:MAG: translation elongation factor Ts [Actinobacteria bacterium]|nr:translation elongation factor Ts [Actinomycetota bacterium]
MVEIPATLVRDLREQTGAGMMDCKRALVETEGDLEQAKTLLRERGVSLALKQAGRGTTEGRVLERLSPGQGTLVAIGCETEPVSGNEEFLGFAQLVLQTVDRDGPDGVSALEDERVEVAARLRENIAVRGAARFEAGDGETVSAYVHPPARKLGVLVKVRGGKAEDARRLAMHIASAAPRWGTREQVPPDHVDAELAIYEKLPDVVSKPEAVRPKIMEGMLSKRFFAQSVLADQTWIYDTSLTVTKALSEAGMEVVDFVRLSVSE